VLGVAGLLHLFVGDEAEGRANMVKVRSRSRSVNKLPYIFSPHAKMAIC